MKVLHVAGVKGRFRAQADFLLEQSCLLTSILSLPEKNKKNSRLSRYT
ncbi:hypothetical protein ACGVWS_09825 [Enterobacteriaceae bacterium LUAb1]